MLDLMCASNLHPKYGADIQYVCLTLHHSIQFNFALTCLACPDGTVDELSVSVLQSVSGSAWKTNIRSLLNCMCVFVFLSWWGPVIQDDYFLLVCLFCSAEAFNLTSNSLNTELIKLRQSQRVCMFSALQKYATQRILWTLNLLCCHFIFTN